VIAPGPVPRRTHPQIVTVVGDSSAPAARRKTLGDLVFGRRLASDEEAHSSRPSRGGSRVVVVNTPFYLAD
jgi:hypothetical protein